MFLKHLAGGTWREDWSDDEQPHIKEHHGSPEGHTLDLRVALRPVARWLRASKDVPERLRELPA